MGDATEGLRNITEHPKHPLKTPQSLGFYMFDSILRQRGIDDPQAPLIAYPATQTGVSDYELFTGEHLNRLIDGACKVFLQRGFEPVVCCPSIDTKVCSTDEASSIKKQSLVSWEPQTSTTSSTSLLLAV